HNMARPPDEVLPTTHTLSGVASFCGSSPRRGSATGASAVGERNGARVGPPYAREFYLLRCPRALATRRSGLRDNTLRVPWPTHNRNPIPVPDPRCRRWSCGTTDPPDSAF